MQGHTNDTIDVYTDNENNRIVMNTTDVRKQRIRGR